ncbi:MAG: hypothetical protein U0441_25640 [Polyangiaceae bacterium]
MIPMELSAEPGARPVLRRIQAFASEGFARLALHEVNCVGARPHVTGLPFIENLGALTIGDDLDLASGPVRSHLVTGVRGVLEIGNHVTIGFGAAIAAEMRVQIGDGAHLGPMVMLLDSDYHVAGDSTAPPEASPIVIGPGAWLGEGVTVLRGATIGRGARVEAGSVVSGNVPEGAHVAGVPARVIKEPPETATLPAQLSPAASEVPSSVEARVLRIAADVFVLPSLPALTDGPKTLPAWDSLGALRLLVSLEEAFSIRLPDGALAGARDLEAVSQFVAKSLAGARRPPVSHESG